MAEIPLPTVDAIRRLLVHRPTFDRPPGELYRDAGNERRPDGSFSFPYAEYVPEFLAFLRDASVLGFVVPFDWPSWERGPELVAEPGRIAEATLEECVKLLTFIVR